MNLHSWSDNTNGGINGSAPMAGCFESFRRVKLFSPTPMNRLFCRYLMLVALAGVFLNMASTAPAQTAYYATNGTEYPVVGSMPGDQVFPDVALVQGGGMVVWQDNATDGSGWGISARQLDSTLSGTLSPFRVNAAGADDQENPRVAMLKNGGAVFVWQGGKASFQHIYARYLSASNTWLTTTDLAVSSTTNYQSFPAVAVLNNSNVVVVWSSFNQVGSNSMQDVYGKILSPAGGTVKEEFLINQFINYNQRTPAVAPLAGGGFMVAWVSEQQRKQASSLGANTTYVTNAAAWSPSVDIYARQFAADGTPSGAEFVVNVDYNACANPAVAGASDGSCLIAWTARDMANFDNSLDVYGRVIKNGVPFTPVFYLNSYLYGDQYAPRLSSLGLDYLATWNSVAQDGSQQGVFGQFVHADGSLTGLEFRVNTTTASQQMHPAVAADGVSRFLVVWTSFSGLANGFDLFAQRYANVSALLNPMSAPFVWAPFTVDENDDYLPELVLSWAPVQGISVASYEIYADGTNSPTAIITSAANQWTMTGLTAGSTHTFKMDYTTTDGRQSPASPQTSGTTWSGSSYYDIPYEWMLGYYGNNIAKWPKDVNAPLAGGGMTLMQVFLSGGNPTNSATWLHQSLTSTSQGLFLTWNTQPGAMYQVQSSTNLVVWSNLGEARFAAGTTDSIYVGGSPVGYYRVVLLR